MSATPPAAPATRNAWLGLVAISLGVSLVVVDFTIVNVIVPPVVTDLRLSSVDAQWIQEIYAITLAALLLLAGRLSDVVGARRLFLIGSVVFGVASIVAALAPNGGTLIGARLGQGVGGAMLLPTSLALLNATFHGPARGKAFAIWGSTIGAAAAVGPFLGGWLGEISWRCAFAVNIVVVAMIIVGVRRFLAPSPSERSSLEVPGVVLSVLGLGLLAFGLIEGRHYGWWEATRDGGPLGISFGSLSVIPVALAVSVVCIVLFVIRQRHLTGSRRAEPLVDTTLFAIPSFRSGNLATVVIGLAEFGILAVLPLWLQFTLGYSTLQTGLMLGVVALGSFAASGAGVGMAQRMPPVRLVRIGLVLEIAGLALLGLLARTDSGWWTVAFGLFLYGGGVGFATAQVTNVVLADVPLTKAGQGSGVQSAARQLGSALGIAVLTTTFFGTLGAGTTDRLRAAGVAAGDAARVGDAVADSAGAAITRLAADPATATAAAAGRQAMTHALQISSDTCAALLLAGLLATVLIPAGSAAPRRSGSADATPAAADEATGRSG